MKKYILVGAVTLGIIGGMSSCSDSPSSVDKKSIESYTSGKVAISADESFQPVIEQEVKVFDSSYPNAVLNVAYLPENEVFKNLFEGKIQMAFTTRQLSAEEKKINEKNNIFTKEMAVAKDAIVVIVNNESEDKKMTVGIVQSILTGKFIRKYKVVLDNKGGSIARYVNDSILGGQALSDQVYAVNNSDEVVKYVSEHKDAIGFIGMTHAFDATADSGYGTFKKEVSVVSIKNDSLQKAIAPIKTPVKKWSSKNYSKSQWKKPKKRQPR